MAELFKLQHNIKNNLCGKKCRYKMLHEKTYRCSTHECVHTCDRNCKFGHTTSEGVFCVLTGNMLQDVAFVSYDYGQNGSRLVRKMSESARKSRHSSQMALRNLRLINEDIVTEIIRRFMCEGPVRTSLEKQAARKIVSRAHVRSQSLVLVMKAMRTGVCSKAAHRNSLWPAAIAREIVLFSTALKVQVGTHAAANNFALIFTATIISKMAKGETTIIPFVNWVARHSFPDVTYSEFGLSCRSMSGMWRKIKAAAQQTGVSCNRPHRDGLRLCRPINPTDRARRLPTAVKKPKMC